MPRFLRGIFFRFGTDHNGQLIFGVSVLAIRVSSVYFFLDVPLWSQALKLGIKDYH